MSGISEFDVEAFTGGRLAATDDETARILKAALSVARNYCGWHVSPIQLDATLTLDGPGGSELFPPTRKIVELTSVTSDGVEVVTDVVVPSQAPWKMVRKTGTWSTEYGGVVITLDHGYSDAEAHDWRQAILTLCDQMGSSTGRPDSALVSKQIDETIYRWQPLAEAALFEVVPLLQNYELRPVFFA